LAPPAAEDEERQQIESQHQVIFVLESAQLEVAQVGKVRFSVRHSMAQHVCAQQQRKHMRRVNE
jgi:hypothetical protein